MRGGLFGCCRQQDIIHSAEREAGELQPNTSLFPVLPRRFGGATGGRCAVSVQSDQYPCCCCQDRISRGSEPRDRRIYEEHGGSRDTTAGEAGGG